jgi:ATP-binding cassette subfamily B protein
MYKGLKSYGAVYRLLWRTYGQSWAVRAAFLLSVVWNISSLIITPVALSLIISRLAVADYDGVMWALGLYAIGSVTMGILSPLTRIVGLKGENPAYAKLTSQYFSHLIRLDIDYFNSNMTGYLTTATRQFLDSTLQMVRNWRYQYMPTLVSIIFPLIVILFNDIFLGLVVFGLSVVQAIYIIWMSHRVANYRQKSREVYRHNSGIMSDAISNILAVRASAQEDTVVNRVESGSKRENKIFYLRYKIRAKLSVGRETISVIFFIVILWLVIIQTQTGHISLAAAVLVATYTSTIMSAIYRLNELLDEHDDLADRILPAVEVLNYKNKVRDPHKPRSFSDVRGDITLANVNFSYQETSGVIRVLRDFSLFISRGQKLGVVGVSGAGKTTLVKLILRFDDVQSGTVKIDGVNVCDVRQDDLHRQIAYVPQEPLLFHASIRDNVLLARPNASDDEVIAALQSAHAWEFIERLPDGLDSVVGERGVKLSGGQKQRVAIARALLQNAPIMILDEATSALDSESEQIIKNSFIEILRDKTAIVVAHRLSTLSEMDRIIVIDDGRIIEDGTPEKLIKNNGLYAKLWHRQQERTDISG